MTKYQEATTLSTIPHDILLRCVVEYLGMRDRYKLLTLCNIWKPLLYQSRTTHIKDDSENPVVLNSWNSFKTSEEHRSNILRIHGLNADDIKSPHRPFRLTLSYEEIVSHSALILQYVQYFDKIAIRFRETAYRRFSEHISETVLNKPSVEAISRFLRSGLQPTGSVQDLTSMWDVAQQASHRILSGDDLENIHASFSSLRGVHRLHLRGDGSLFVEISPDSTTQLHTVVLDGCTDIDVSSLQEVPEVRLGYCDQVINMSALANVDIVELKGMQLNDISMLGNVRKLVLNNCGVAVYPVPSCGKGQEWEFHDMFISDVSTLASLEKLTLEKCEFVFTVAMLGNVKCLHINKCNYLTADSQFPTPLQQDQEWTFTDMDMTCIAAIQFSGLHSLTLNKCQGVDLSGIKTITRLELVDCTLQTADITHMDIHEFSLVQCPVISFGDGVVITELDIQLGAKQPQILFLSAATRAGLASLRIRNELLYTIVDFAKEELTDIDLLLVDANSVVCRCYQTSELKLLRTEAFTDNRLRTAVELWCIEPSTATCLYGDINSWDVSQVTDMSELFSGKNWFNSNIANWDVSNVTKMSGMFSGATFFNQPLNSWKVGNVTTMDCMFDGASTFNQQLDSWDVSNVTDMSCMFTGVSYFNQSLNPWNVGKVTDMTNMFYGAVSFDNPLDDWNVSHVTEMSGMFFDASSFNQPLNSWCVGKVEYMRCMFSGAAAFNQPIGNWDVGSVKSTRYMFYGAISFNQPIDGWNVSKVTDTSFMFWNASAFNQPLGTWDVSNVMDINGMYYGAYSFNNPLDSWEVQNVINMSNMFYDASSFNQPLNSWKVGNVKYMNDIFHGATAFDQPVGSWDVSHVVDMSGMLSGSASFNQPINSWDVSNVTNMSCMFSEALAFDQPLSNWNVSNVTGMCEMFRGASSFNQPLHSWNVSNVVDALDMFREASSFNQPLGGWTLTF